MQDHESLCAAVTVCATLVNIRTDRHTQTDSTDGQHFNQLIRIVQPAELKMKRM